MKNLPTKPWSTHLFVFFSEKSSKHIESVKKTRSLKKKKLPKKNKIIGGTNSYAHWMFSRNGLTNSI